jgi:hypothetical protein
VNGIILVAFHCLNKPRRLERPAYLSVASDLEWYEVVPGAKVVDAIQGKITQVGWTVFPMSASKDCKTPADFTALIKKSSMYCVHIIESYHLCSKQWFLQDIEKNALYCQLALCLQKKLNS